MGLPAAGRSPHGEHGLKLAGMLLTTQAAESLPARGAWIEIPKIGGMCKMKKSLPARGAWIEITYGLLFQCQFSRSLPARGAWIEITTGTMTARETTVAPRTGSMD